MENNRSTIFHIYSVIKSASEENPMNAEDIAKQLAKWGMRPNRKTIYAHLAGLQELSDQELLDGEIEFVGEHRRKAVYFRPAVSKAEAKLLCDAIASSRFIGKTQSKELIQKLAAQYSDD